MVLNMYDIVVVKLREDGKKVDVNATKVDMPKTKLVTLIPSHK